MRKEVLLVDAAGARKEGLELRETGDWEEASLSLRERARQIRESGLSDDLLAEELADLESSAELFDLRSFEERDVKYLKQRHYSSMRSRHSGKDRYRRE